MKYELAKQLKDAGFSQKNPSMFLYDELGSLVHLASDRDWSEKETDIKIPTLSELIEACGDYFGHLDKVEHNDGERELSIKIAGKISGWNCVGYIGDKIIGGNYGSTPEEAVAHLWLALNNK